MYSTAAGWENACPVHGLDQTRHMLEQLREPFAEATEPGSPRLEILVLAI